MKWSRRREHSIFTNATSLLLCGILGGVVVAAAAFPAIAMGGLAAKAGADTFAELPKSLDVPIPPQISRLYASDGKTLIGNFYDENRHDVPLSEIPQVMRDAIVAAEDNRFYDHNGVDIKGVLRAFLHNKASGEDSGQGASTLTMQYVRNALTYGATTPAEVLAATEETNDRKIREIRLALGLEQLLTKDQILQNYLNIAAFGRGAYGIYAASQVYFGKEPKDLTLPEAALLAGLPKAPSEFNPATPEGAPQALARRAYVLDQMVSLGMISAQQGALAKASPLDVTGERTPRDCIATTQNNYGFFCDYFYRWWADQPEFGVDAAARTDKLKSGGYRIISTLDVKAQKTAYTTIQDQLSTGHSDALVAAAIEPNTGYVRVMAANRNFSNDDSHNGKSTDPAKRKAGIKGTYPNTTNPLLSGGDDISGFKAGSTFKLFTLLAALQNGYPLSYTINVTTPYHSKYVLQSRTSSACSDLHWCPKNDSTSEVGPYNMWTGLGRSVNTFFVPLIERVGASKAIAMAERLGIHFRNQGDRDFVALGDGAGPFTLGVTDVVPLELADAYATVAAEGVYCEPLPVVTLFDVQGDEVSDVTEPRCKQAISRDIALAAADALHCPVRMPGGTGHCNGSTAVYDSPGIVKKPVIGKTGTSDEGWTKSYILSTKQLTIAAVLANPDFAETPHHGAITSVPQVVANNTLRDFMKGKPSQNWDLPPSILVTGKQVAIPNVVCKSVDDATALVRGAGFTVSVSSTPVTSDCAKGTVAGTDPSGHTAKGSDVQLILSDGPAPGGGGGGGPGDGGGGPGGGGGGGGIPPPTPPTH
ncbi:MAG TPA: transglycosylase domain-containing protein [Micromonosporaceae bacterium]